MNKIKWQSLDLENIPRDAGLYVFKFNERWLYIGNVNNLSLRLNNHHLPLQIGCKYFPIASFLYYLEDSLQKLKHKLHKQNIFTIYTSYN